jgi:hypothetical protein
LQLDATVEGMEQPGGALDRVGVAAGRRLVGVDVEPAQVGELPAGRALERRQLERRGKRSGALPARR